MTGERNGANEVSEVSFPDKILKFFKIGGKVHGNVKEAGKE